MKCGLALIGLGLVFSLWTAAPADEVPVDPYAAKVRKASDEGLKAIKTIRVPKGLTVDLFAAEPHVANIVSFCIDAQGRFYVAETFRLHQGVSDNRGQRWLDDDLASRTVADRLTMYKKYLGKKFDTYGKEQDRIRLVEDTKGTGRADKSTIFADGFKSPAEGLGAGVLARGGKVWYTCIPNLWLLEDTTGTGRANVRKALHTGYGVHVSFIGHDMHGLKFGPDGKLYFSIGDRGFNVETGGKVLANPDSGAVLRCDPDGANLEIVATGLRNPQELAFNKYGDLFTGDNNADGGDAARWVQIVEGGDSGWRIGYQYMKGLGPWNGEKMWHVAADIQPAHVLPPVAHIANGPSGVTYFPGTGQLPDRYQDHFFLVDFRGSSGGSGIHAFALKPKGASFEIIDQHQFVWSVLATDCDFGPDGVFYLSDWVEGWGLTNKGRIYKVFDATRAHDPTVLEVKKLMAEGMSKRSIIELVGMLAHQDMRIRQEAQFTLAQQGAMTTLAKVSRKGAPLARLHAIWGLGQIGRQDPAAYKHLVSLLDDQDAEVRAQATKVLGEDQPIGAALGKLVAGLKDAEPRVRFFAALALAKIGKAETLPAVLDMLRTNADTDAYLRHAGVMALVGINDRKALQKAADDTAPSVRLAVLLAMRRLAMPEIDRLLRDVDAKVALEAARAIYEEPIPAALPALAALLQRPAGALANVPLPIQGALFLRALNANFRLGMKENAQAIAAFAARPGAPEKMKLEALEELSQWEKPSGRDRVLGLWRPIEPRSGQDLAEVLGPALAGIMTSTDKVRAAGARLAAKHGIKEIAPILRALVADKSKSAGVRVETLKALEMLKDDQLLQIAELALADQDPHLRNQGRRIVVGKKKPSEAAIDLALVLDHGATAERQGALAILAGLKTPEADRILGQWMDKLMDKRVPAEMQLDVLEGARHRGTAGLNDKLAKYQAALPKGDPLAAYREALAGGDAESGRRIFFDKTDLSCLRCHKVQGVGGEVGPDLTGIGKKEKREYLLESLVDPNKQIAKGFETVVLSLSNGQVKSGILKSEDSREVRLLTPEGLTMTVRKDLIEERNRGPSAMPGDLVQKMSRSELRDLVEFLSSLQ
ncbi:MAG TPA: PVC-type heme-binding CxxCH protein [Gemmataceae bacterium]|nr:PVC-type heme-binding CxxCH protein [Gemmataceae bacterium]